MNGSGVVGEIVREHSRDGMRLHGLLGGTEDGKRSGNIGNRWEIDREHSREYRRETLSGMVGNAIGNARWRHG